MLLIQWVIDHWPFAWAKTVDRSHAGGYRLGYGAGITDARNDAVSERAKLQDRLDEERKKSEAFASLADKQIEFKWVLADPHVQTYHDYSFAHLAMRLALRLCPVAVEFSICEEQLMLLRSSHEVRESIARNYANKCASLVKKHLLQELSKC